MRPKRFLAALALCLCMAPAAPGLAQTGAAGQPPPSAGAMGAVSHDPAVVATLKKAVDAQGDISPYTLKALERDPLALEAVGRPAAGKTAPQASPPAATSGATPKNTKAIYGDIIIHR